MRKIRIVEHISMDGVIQPGGPNENSEYSHGGWIAPYRSEGGAEAIAEAQGKGFDLLLGRRTYDLWSDHWPKMKGGLFADALNAATKYVATHRPEGLAWGPVGDLGADVLEGIRRLKSQDGPDLLVWGSASLTAALFEQGLVDEVVLIVYPILLGRVNALFRTARTRSTSLSSARSPRRRVCSSTLTATSDRREPPEPNAVWPDAVANGSTVVGLELFALICPLSR